VRSGNDAMGRPPTTRAIRVAMERGAEGRRSVGPDRIMAHSNDDSVHYKKHSQRCIGPALLSLKCFLDNSAEARHQGRAVLSQDDFSDTGSCETRREIVTRCASHVHFACSCIGSEL